MTLSLLDRILSEESSLIERFVGCLQREQDLLIAAEHEGLAPIIEEKQTLVMQLNQLEEARNQITSVGGVSGKDSMERWFDAHPDALGTRTLWEGLLQQAARARELHTMNGSLIELHLKHTNDALSELTKTPARGAFALYGSNGLTSTTTGSRIVDSA